MGKVDHSQTTTTPNSGSSNSCCLTGCSRVKKLVNFKCVFLLVLGIGVLLSAVFWLPFFHFGDRRHLDLDYADHDIVASFMLTKPASFLKSYTLQLEDNIFDEMRFSSTEVEILSLESSTGSNTTKVVFAVESDATTQSLIRDSFETLVTHQSFLQFTSSLFGNPFSFDVLKFKGGITATPEQKAFLLQQVQIRFNFTLNFSIDQLVNSFDELTSQLKTGLHLTPYENLYIRLSNLKGSTVSPPTIVESRVFLAVGIPSKSRFKQLAQSITGPHAKNLGLNNSLFGHVKQVRLSSVTQRSLGNDGTSPSPSPSPSPTRKSRSRYHHRNHDANFPPSISPSPPISTHVPAPAPWKTKAAEPPCQFGYNSRPSWTHKKHYPVAPSVPPAYAGPWQSKQTVSAESPSPKVGHVHRQSPSHGKYHAWPPDSMPLVSPPPPSPSSAGIISCSIWELLLLGLYFIIEAAK